MITRDRARFATWSYPIVVAHYRIYGDPDSWDAYGERHVVINTGETMPDYRDWPNFYYLKRRT
jgi:hypothetical protein